MAKLFEGYRDTRVVAGSRAPYGMVHEALSQMFLRFEGFMTV